MWFSSHSDSGAAQSERPLGRAKRVAVRSREARRLFLEGLEDRSLMAFNVVADYTTGPYPIDITLAPINAGAELDMVVINSGDSSISVRLGNSDGTFGPSQVSPTGSSPNSLATGDITGDGIADVVTGNSADVSLLKGNGDGTFAAPTSISLPAQIAPGNPDPSPVHQHPLSVATGDLNADGKLDLIVGTDTYFTQKSCYTGYYGGYYCNYFNTFNGYVNVLLGNGTGGFGPAEVHHLGTDRLPVAVAVGDINGDGKADVISANSGDLSVLLGNGSGAVGSPINSGSGYALRSISLGDADGDGKVDTLLSTGYGLLSVQKGDGLGHFTALPGVSAGAPINSAVMGDVNADGKLDLVAVGATNNFTCTSSGYYGCYDGYYTTNRQATVLVGNGSGNFASPLTSSLGSDIGYGWLPDIAVADLTGDGRPDLVTIDYNFGKAIVATNDGDWNPPPAIVISDASIVEGNSGTVSAVFTVTLVGAHSGSVSVNFATANNTAVAGSDYTSTSGPLTFGPGELTKTISVPVKGDTIAEYDEQFFVNLSNPIGGVITDSQGIGTIVDDDPAPRVTIDDVSKNEGNRGNTSFVFTVSLSAASGKQVSVNFATADGTAKVSGNDYFAGSGTIYFSPGQTTATITILVRGDKTKEVSETFFVNLTGATNAAISDSQAVGTIVSDDGGAGGGKGKPHNVSIAALLLTDPLLSKTVKRK